MIKQKKQAKKKTEMVEEPEEQFELDIDEEDVQQIEADEHKEDEAMQAFIKKANTKGDRKEKTQKILDFKFRTMELVEIFLKKTKDPSIFLKHVAPLVATLKDNQKDKVKEAFVNKVSALLKYYIHKQQNFGLDYSADVEACVAEILFSARKISTPKIQKVLKYLVKCFLALIFKAELKYPVEGLVQKFREAFDDFLHKSNIELDEDYFKELVSKYKVIGLEMLDLLIQGSNLKEFGGSKKDSRRDDCLNLLTTLVSTSQDNLEIARKLIQNQKSLAELFVNVLENFDQIKNKKVAAFKKYYHLSVLIIKLLNKVANDENADDKLKQKASSLSSAIKSRMVKRIKGLEENPSFKDQKNGAEKLEKMIEAMNKIE